MEKERKSFDLRMTRLERLVSPCPVYFITACTQNRIHLLNNNEVFQIFRDFCSDSHRYDVYVGKFLLMPDHFHLFVQFGERGSLSDWMKSLKNRLSKHFREKGIAAPHWQKGFFDHVIRSNESYSNKWLYVVENPIRAGLVSNTKDWLYQGEMFPLEGSEL
jgi:putative transposase